jgi:hypothetical protein
VIGRQRAGKIAGYDINGGRIAEAVHSPICALRYPALWL